MQFKLASVVSVALLAASAMAQPVENAVEKCQTNPISQIVHDHNFVDNPDFAKEPFPADELDNPAREAHRGVHEVLGPFGRFVPKIPEVLKRK